jgi:hypothetical protein
MMGMFDGQQCNIWQTTTQLSINLAVRDPSKNLYYQVVFLE